MKSRAAWLVAILGMSLLQGASAPEGLTPMAELREGFEPPPPGFTNGLTPSWSVIAGNASVTSETSYSGNYSLKIDATEPPGQVIFNLPSLGNNSVTFVDFRLLPVAAAAEEAANTVDAAGALAGFLRVGKNGKLFAYDAKARPGTWRDSGTVWSTRANGTLSQWVRISMRLVPAAHTWDLYVDGNMVLADLGLESVLHDKLVLFGDLRVPVYVDDLYAGAVNPLFVDLNGDGLPDNWVAGMGLAGADRNAAYAGNGRSLLDNYLEMINAAQAAPTVGSATGTSEAVLGTRLVFVDPIDGNDANDGLKTSAGLVAAMETRASIAKVGTAQQALLSAVQANSARPTQNVNGGATGPKKTLTAALATAQNGDTIVLLAGPTPYEISDFNPNGANITITPIGDVLIAPAASNNP